MDVLLPIQLTGVLIFITPFLNTNRPRNDKKPLIKLLTQPTAVYMKTNVSRLERLIFVVVV